MSLVEAAELAEQAGALRSPLAGVAGHVAELERLSRLPDRVGPWRVTGLLGEGGMGVVYRAERADGMYARAVAVKRIHPLMGPGLSGRLEAERRVLARLEHAGIARLYDAGVADDGAPYVVMELVEGCPITEYADREALGVAARAGLLALVCDAVAYAHRHLVVHRDLKPSNVLVASGDGGAPAVKLLDFGIAKLLDPPIDGDGSNGAGSGARTLTGTHAAMTPSYAAPEQIRRGDVTTATDVYALGVMLYELLAGRRPYDLTAASPAEAERLVCEQVPSAPSTVAPSDRARHVRGDLDTIVSKALEKEPARRYPSAEALAADLRRHLGGLPVDARVPTAGYRASRFVRRNRVAVTAGLVVVCALLTGAGVALKQARAARAESDKAQAVSDFLQSTLLSAGPSVGGAVRPSDLRVVDVLRPAAEQAQVAFPDRQDVRASVLHTVGRTYLDLGLWEEARQATHQALAIRDSLYGNTPHEERIQSYGVAARVAQMRNDTSGIGWARRALGLRVARHGRNSAEVAEGLMLYGDILAWFGRHDAALAALKSGLTIAERSAGLHSPQANETRMSIALVYMQTDRAAEADALFEALVASARRHGSADDLNLGLYLHRQSVTALFQRNVARATRLNAEALELLEARFDGDHPQLNEARGIRAALLIEHGQFEEAEPIMRAAVEAFESSFGGTDRFELHLARAELGAALAGLGRTAEAELLLRPGTERLREKFGDRYGWTRHAARHLADLYDATGRAAEARRYRWIADAPSSPR
jgi:serine/threonine-protein kinase